MPSVPRSPSVAPRDDLVARVSRWWACAALAGIGVAVVIAARWPFRDPGPVLRPLLAMGIGWSVVLMAAPWPLVARLARQRRMVRGLGARLRAIADERGPGRTALARGLDGPAAEAAGAAARLLERLDAQERGHRSLQRTMDETIRRETRRATVHLERAAETDPLTGLGNRRRLDRAIAELFDPDAPPRPVAILAIDLDGFKPVNDALGHEIGDVCLRELGTLLAGAVRGGDIAVRLGGDEFVVLLADATRASAEATAKRLAALHRQQPWPHAAAPRPTLSIGVAAATPPEGPDHVELMRRADAALYDAKRRGRDTVAVWRAA